MDFVAQSPAGGHVSVRSRRGRYHTAAKWLNPMLTDIVLVQGPLVGTAGMLPLAERVHAGARHVHVPDVVAAQGHPPAWRAWSSHLLGLLALDGRMPILVGYSASTVLAAELATKLPVHGIIFLDGDIPPASGPVRPGSERLRRRVDDLVDNDGGLPLWSDWWTTEEEKQGIGIADLARDPSAMERFRRDQP